MTDDKRNEKESEYEKFCMLCRRSARTAGRLLELPNGFCICRDCVKKVFDTMHSAGLDQTYLSALAEQFPQLAGLSGADLSGLSSLTPEQFSRMTGMSLEQLAKMTGITPEQLAGASIFQNGSTQPAKSAQEKTENTVPVSSFGEPEPAGEALVVEKDAAAEGENGAGDGRKDTEDDSKNIHTTISMINLGDLFGSLGLPQRQQVRKKKAKEKPPKKEIDMKNIPAPHRIKAKLDEYVIGQEHAKRVLSVAVYNHYKRIAAGKEASDDVELEKSNMLMLGPTGCGKTYLVKTLARLLDVPLAITDATSLTEAGYIGDDIESVISRLLAAADNDVERAEQGIVFIDEIDKIARKKNTNQRDVSGEAVQQGMLKLLEGSEVEVPVGAASKNAMVPMTIVDTSNILFICGGAFPGLDEIIKERLNRQASIGFFSDLKDKYDDDPNLLEKVTVDDLRAFGMIPEFLGRLPILFSLQALTKEMLVRILKEPRNAILRQYQKLLALDEVDLQFDDAALEVIAERAMEKKTGARALRAIIEDFMLDIMYEVPKDDSIGSVRITKEYLEHTGGPVIALRTGN